MGQVAIKDFNLGGLSDSRYQGLPNSLYRLVGFDLNAEPGLLKVSQKLKKESGSTVDALVKAVVVCSNGESYLFSSTTGKVWRRKANGTYELAYTTSPAAGGAGCLGAREYNGYIYWATESRLHRITTANALTTSWSVLDLNWQTFSNTDALYHPMTEQNLVLYIGDGKDVAQVDNTTWSASALDLFTPNRISALGRYLTDILVGTFRGSYINHALTFRWNTWASSFSALDETPEIGINCFLPTDNIVVVQAGKKGRFYYFDGASLQRLRRLPGDWTGMNEAIVYPDAAANFQGVPLFGVSNVSGNPALQGVYQLGSYDRGYPEVLALQFPISTGNLSGVEIGAIAVVGTDVIVTWKDTTGGTAYGVDVIDTANKFDGAYLETRSLSVERNKGENWWVHVAYKSLPTSTAIKIYADKNHAGSYTEITDKVTDTDRKLISAKVRVDKAATAQFKVLANVNANDAPEIEQVIIEQS